MAARTRRIAHDANTRAKIKASQIINRLQKHIDGEVELESTQIRAAEILLNKCLPNLQSVEMKVEGEVATVTRTAMSVDEWQKKAEEQRVTH